MADRGELHPIEPNPDRETEGRHADVDAETSQLRRICRHEFANGVPCEHSLYWLGVKLVERVIDVNGATTVAPATITEYYQRGVRTTGKEGGVTAFGPCHEYFTVTNACSSAGEFTEGTPPFHIGSISTDPDYDWGEVDRVFVPTITEGQFPRRAPNDNEARHTNPKALSKYLRIDVLRQGLRLLGAAVPMNSVTW
ncbi:hypothetical protein N9C30_00290 [bacterium]|nr:hypothetical protein [bacterium]